MGTSDLGTSGILQALRLGRMSRREALGALTALGVGAAGSPLFAGLAEADSGELMGPGGIPLARPDRPVTLPTYEDPIASGLKPETGGTFNVFNYADYVDPKLLKAFGKKYDVEVLVTSFDSIDEAITKIASGTVRMDVTEITNNRIAQAVAGKLLKPINHDYVPNLKQNVWPSLQSPYYDVGSRYSVPYTIYSTGIGWRSDKVAEDIHKLDNPWSIFWSAQKYAGYTAVLDDSREAMALAMLHRQHYDINTEDPKIIDQSLADMLALIPVCNPKVNTTGYQTLPQGASWLNHTWSGNMLTAIFSELPKGFDPSVLQYWAAPKGKGPVQNDMWAVCATAAKPVLAHLWLDFILDEDNAYHNFIDFNGYQPPINSVTGASLIAKGLIPPNLQTAIMSPDDFGQGSLQESQLTSQGQKLWQNAFARFTSGG
ncbi:MAG: polyamine ABC transporter substrate-binding protein [Candidatus Acidiferrales bacterium]